ncbi:MAG: hypothetical protein KatS3mg068_1975 [Candidatus Sericytochromatia bacterium]|nr:MAG: hypothetical protein KatS3mg068_1975 [Candidatus Sericytochromatia bacterium]
MDRKFLSGTIFGLALGIGITFVTPIISQPIDIKIDNKKTTIKKSNNSNTDELKTSNQSNNTKDDKNTNLLNENLQKILLELKDLNQSNKEAIKYLKNIDSNTKFQNPYGSTNN